MTFLQIKQANTETVEVISFEQSFSINEIQSVICEHGESSTLSLNSTWSVLLEYPILFAKWTKFFEGIQIHVWDNTAYINEVLTL